MDSSGKSESSPLLGAKESVPNAGDVGDGVKDSGRALLREPRNQWRNKRRRPQSSQSSASSSSSGGAASSLEFSPANSAARVSRVVGVVMFAIALGFLAAVFRAIPRRYDSTPSSIGSSGAAGGLKMETKMENAGTPATPARMETPTVRESRSRADKVFDTRKEETRKESNGKASPGAQVGDQVKPNVFFILIDDMGFEDIGYINPGLHGVTPNLDRLASGGIKLTNYYSMSICTPARASLMTGRYVMRYGFQYNEAIQDTGPWGLPLTEKIFPEYMKDAGYETHMVGKWHLGFPTSDYIPSERGFDTFLGYLTGEETYWSHETAKKFHGRKFFDFGFGNETGYFDVMNDRPLPKDSGGDSLSDDDGSDDDDDLSPVTTTSSSMSPSGDGNFTGLYSTEIFQERAIEILKGKTPFDEEPLYLYLAHQAVHTPLGLPPEGSFSHEEIALLSEIKASSMHDPDQRERFAKVLMYLDHTIGDLVDYLEKEGWMENSIIVVASDNGACAAHGGSNYPLRGYKSSYFEGGFKVPAFIYSPSHIPQELWGTEYDGLMHVTDWIPTIASAAGFDPVGGAGPLDGIDHWGTLVNTDGAKYESPRQELLYNLDPYTLWTTDDDDIKGSSYPLAQGAFRSGRYKFISNAWCTGWYTFDRTKNEEDPLTNRGNVCNGTPCTPCNHCPGYVYYDFLFDVEADPREEKNIIEEYPEIAESLRNRWIEVAFSEWTDSVFESEDSRAYRVWAKNLYWVSPWRKHVGGITKDLFQGE